MAKKTTNSAPWQALEEQAYHAYREWPIWLVLRAKELSGRVTPGNTKQHQGGAPPHDAAPETPKLKGKP